MTKTVEIKMSDFRFSKPELTTGPLPEIDPVVRAQIEAVLKKNFDEYARVLLGCTGYGDAVYTDENGQHSIVNIYDVNA